MKYTVPRKMKPMKLVEMQKEWWNMYEVGPKGFYRTDKPAGPVIADWHSLPTWGCRLFGLVHDGAVVSFLAASFRKREPVVHINLTYTPQEVRGKGYAREMKRQFWEFCKQESRSGITVDCQTPEGEALRDDANYSHVSVWEHAGDGKAPVRHKEALNFEHVHPSQRSYK